MHLHSLGSVDVSHHKVRFHSRPLDNYMVSDHTHSLGCHLALDSIRFFRCRDPRWDRRLQGIVHQVPRFKMTFLINDTGIGQCTSRRSFAVLACSRVQWSDTRGYSANFSCRCYEHSLEASRLMIDTD